MLEQRLCPPGAFQETQEALCDWNSQLKGKRDKTQNWKEGLGPGHADLVGCIKILGSNFRQREAICDCRVQGYDKRCVLLEHAGHLWGMVWRWWLKYQRPVQQVSLCPSVSQLGIEIKVEIIFFVAENTEALLLVLSFLFCHLEGSLQLPWCPWFLYIQEFPTIITHGTESA